MELDGFADDKRCDRTVKPERQVSENNQSLSSADTKSGSSPNASVKEEEVVRSDEANNKMDLILEILKMDSENHNSGILPVR